MYAAVLEQIRMEKRLKASAAGLQELQVLRERHQQEIQHLLASLRSVDKSNDSTISECSDTPPPLPPRSRASSSSSVSSRGQRSSPRHLEPTPPRRSSFPKPDATSPRDHLYSIDKFQGTLDRNSTFRRPRQLSQTVYKYPSPMHAVLMQYPKSDTKGLSIDDKTNNGDECDKTSDHQVIRDDTVQRESDNQRVTRNATVQREHQQITPSPTVQQSDSLGLCSDKTADNDCTDSRVSSRSHLSAGVFLETTFPADGDEPICSHCDNCNGVSCSLHTHTERDNQVSANQNNDSWEQHFITRFIRPNCSDQEQSEVDSSQKNNNNSNCCDLDETDLKDLHTNNSNVADNEDTQIPELLLREQNTQCPRPISEQLTSCIKKRKERNSRNLSGISEEGYFSCSEMSFGNSHCSSGRQSRSRQSVTSLFSNDSLMGTDPDFDAPEREEKSPRWFVVSEHGKPRVYCFNDEVENEDHVFV